MSKCCYDNPKTLVREVWADGDLVWGFTKKAMHLGTDRVPKEFLKDAHLGPWEDGKLSGDPKAMEKGNGK